MKIKKRYLALGGTCFTLLIVYGTFFMDSLTGPDDKDLYPTIVPLTQEENGFYSLQKGIREFSEEERNTIRRFYNKSILYSSSTTNNEEIENSQHIRALLDMNAKSLTGIIQDLEKPYQNSNLIFLTKTEDNLALNDYLDALEYNEDINAIVCSYIWILFTEKKYNEVNHIFKNYLTFINTSIKQPLTAREATIHFEGITSAMKLINEFTITDPYFVPSREVRNLLRKEIFSSIETVQKNIVQGEYYFGKHAIIAISKNTSDLIPSSIPKGIDKLLELAYFQKNTTLLQYHKFFQAIQANDHFTIEKMTREREERQIEKRGYPFFNPIWLERNSLGNAAIETVSPSTYYGAFWYIPKEKLIPTIHLLDTTLAIQEYQRKNKMLPDTLEELIPEYLPSIPNSRPAIKYDKILQVVYYDNNSSPYIEDNSQRAFITIQGRKLVEFIQKNTISQIRSKEDKEIIPNLLKVKLALQKYYKEKKDYPPSLETLITEKYISEIPTLKEEKMNYSPELGIVFYYQPSSTEEQFSRYLKRIKSQDPLWLVYIEALRYREIFDPIKEKFYLEMKER